MKKSELQKTRRPQVGVQLTEEQNEYLEYLVNRYKKKDRSRVILEIFEQYAKLYEEAEEARLKTIEDQISQASGGSLGKSPDVSKRLGPKRQAS